MLDSLFTGGALWFTVPALVGTGVFLLRVLFMMIGIGDGHDAGAGDLHHADGSHTGAVFSIQSGFAFLMGFGWVGLIGLKTLHWGWGPSAGLGVAGGVAMVALLTLMMQALRRLTVSGNIPLSATLAATGEVTAGIPEKGKGAGEVRLVVNDRHRTSAAVSDGPALPTRTRVKVIAANPDNTVTVAQV